MIDCAACKRSRTSPSQAGTDDVHVLGEVGGTGGAGRVGGGHAADAQELLERFEPARWRGCQKYENAVYEKGTSDHHCHATAPATATNVTNNTNNTTNNNNTNSRYFRQARRYKTT